MGLLRNWRVLMVPIFVIALSMSSSVGLGWAGSIASALSGVGVCLNQLVIYMNDGKMPVCTDSIPVDQEANYEVMDSRTRLAILGDCLQIKDWLISPGDVCLYLGLAIAICGRIIK